MAMLMKVVLRNEQNGLYFQSPTQWAPTPTDALDFLGTGQALQAAEDSRLENVQVVLSFGDPKYDIVLPLATGLR
jgi:hypothetical protein